MDILDLIILCGALGSAIRGLRLGATVQVLSFVGFVVGLAVGVPLVRSISPRVAGTDSRMAVTLALLLVPALVFSTAGRIVGIRLHRHIRRARLGPLDAGAGAVFAAAGVLVSCWLLASIFVDSRFATVATQIEHSAILRGVDDILPPVPNAFAGIERFLGNNGFPEAIIGVLPGPIGPVSLPNSAAVRAAVDAAGSSTVRVVGIGCGGEQEGSGFVVAPDLVVTNAHVVAGISGSGSITVDVPPGNRTVVATPIFFDPRFDLAVLKTSDLGVPVLHLDGGYVGAGTKGAVLGYPGGGDFTAVRAAVLVSFRALGKDIYDQSLTSRDVYELRATVRPGNSGGPLVEPNGEVVGVVFSRSETNPTIGYALASPGVLSRVREAELHPTHASTQGCTNA